MGASLDAASWTAGQAEEADTDDTVYSDTPLAVGLFDTDGHKDEHQIDLVDLRFRPVHFDGRSGGCNEEYLLTHSLRRAADRDGSIVNDCFEDQVQV